MEEIRNILKDIREELRRQNKAQQPTVREIMDVQQAAEYLGLSEYTLREWVRKRKIPHLKVNGSLRFRKSKLDRWLDHHEVILLK